MNEEVNVGDNMSPTDSFGEIHIEIEVNPVNRMTAKYTLFAVNDNEILTEITVRQFDENDINVEINPRVLRNSDKETFIDIKYRGNSDVLAEIQPIILNNVEVEIEVPPQNRMWAIYEIQEPPIVQAIYQSSKDSFVRKDVEYETVNYGSNSSMVVGRQYGDEWQSYLQFNISNFNPSYKVTGTKLRVYYSGVIPNGVKVNLYEVGSLWQEYSITYLNRPQDLTFVTDEYFVNPSERYVEFDVTELVNNWIQGNKVNNGFAIKLSDDSYDSQIVFRTKESMQPPQLIISHYDARIFSTGRSQLLTEIYSMKRGNKDIPTEIEVGSTFNFDSVDVVIVAHRPEDPLHEDVLTEITPNKSIVPIEISVSLHKDNEVLSELTVRNSRDDNINSEITVNKPALATEIFVKYNNDILTEITSSYHRDDDIFVEISVGVYDENIESEISVTKDYVFTEITPRIFKYDEVYTEISVTKPNVDSEIYVKYVDEILVEIEANLKSDTLAEITVNKPDVYVEISCARRDDSDISSEIFVSYTSEIDTEINVHVFSQIETEINVKQFNQIEAEIISTKPYTFAEITVPYVDDSDVNIEILPRILKVNNVPVTITVSGKKGAYVFIM